MVCCAFPGRAASGSLSIYDTHRSALDRCAVSGKAGISRSVPLTTIDWLWILHPALAVVFVYPLVGMVARLGLQARARRTGNTKVPVVSGRDHTDLGRWLAAAVVVVSLVALSVVITTHAAPSWLAGGAARSSQLLLVLLGTVVAFVALWRATAPALRGSFALITWLGVIALGAQPEVFRGSDDPLTAEFWQSHYWGGVALVGVMLFSLGARREILSQLRWRRVHVTLSVLAAVLFLIQGTTGSRDLLQIPLSWQKPALQACDWSQLRCPAPQPQATRN